MKKIILVSLIFILSACKTIHYSHFNIYYFYAKGCANCEACDEKVINDIKKEFGSDVTIHYIDLDTKEGQDLYYEYVHDLLSEVPKDYYTTLQYPFMVIDDDYAFFGCNPKFSKDYIEDIKASQTNKTLSNKLELGRYYFKGDN